MRSYSRPFPFPVPQRPRPTPALLQLHGLQMPEQRQRTLTEEVQRRDMLLSWLRGYVSQQITRLVAAGDPHDVRLLTEQVNPGVLARVMRDSIYKLHTVSHFLRCDEHEFQRAQQMLTDVVPGVFNEFWEEQRHNAGFITERDAPGARDFTRTTGGDDTTEIDPFLEDVDRMFTLKYPPAIFERVRNAAYVTINSETYPEYRDRLFASYRRHWLTPETIAKLRDPKEVGEFTKETRKGIFVYGIDERVDGKPSVAEQMDEDFSRRYGPRDRSYVGKALVGDDGEVLSWLTYWQTPAEPNGRALRDMRSYLDRGVTGGRMKYTGAPDKDTFSRNIKTLLMFDTISGGPPMASARLFAKSVQDMLDPAQGGTPHLTNFVAYRLYELHMEPAIRRNRIMRLADNKSSDNFFNRYGCEEFAIDFSLNGPRSERVLPALPDAGVPDGQKMYLNPRWVAFSGEFDTILSHAWAVWRSMQHTYGDVTNDGVLYEVLGRAIHFKTGDVQEADFVAVGRAAVLDAERRHSVCYQGRSPRVE